MKQGGKEERGRERGGEEKREVVRGRRKGEEREGVRKIGRWYAESQWAWIPQRVWYTQYIISSAEQWYSAYSISDSDLLYKNNKIL